MTLRPYRSPILASLDFQIVGPDLVSGPRSRAAEANGLPASGSPTKVQVSRAFGVITLPRRRCVGVLVVLLAVGAFARTVLGAEVVKPEDRFRGGKVEWARLKHSGEYWDRHAESDDALLSFIRSNTTLNIDSVWHAAPASDLAVMTEYPFLFADTLDFLNPAEQRNLAEYLRRGGFILIDMCGNVKINSPPEHFLSDHLQILRAMFPDFRCEELTPKHEVFSIYFKMTEFPPQSRPGTSLLEGFTNPLRLLYAGDRVIGILSLSGLQCGWSGADHAPRSYMMMVTNIYLYAITR